MALKKEDKQIIEKIVSGVDRVDAYKSVYPGSAKSDQVIRSTVCRMINRKEAKEYKEKCEQRLKEEKIKIKTEVSELIREKTAWAIQDSIDALKFVIEGAKEDAREIRKRNLTSDKYTRVMPTVTATPIISAVERLNKMLGIEGQDTGINKAELTNIFIDATDFDEDPNAYKAPQILEAPTGEGNDE